MEEVYKNIFKILVPLENNPLKELNVYLIKGKERNLLIDSGFNNEKALSALMNGLKELDADLHNTDVLLTHLHGDHTGLASAVKTPKNKVYMSRIDAIETNIMLLDSYWAWYVGYQKEMGFPSDEVVVFEDQPAFVNRHDNFVDFTYLEPGEKLTVGEYNFDVLDLKGHTPGHIGLYEPEKHLLFPGDTLMVKITPHISKWAGKSDYLGDYLNTLGRLKSLKIDRVFTGHRKNLDDPYERIEQMFAHHDKRLNWILDILSESDADIYKVASGIQWEYGGGNFLNFPRTQKWFATHEVYAHLIHLELKGKVTRERNENEVVIWRLAN